jgi:hypothetical protein
VRGLACCCCASLFILWIVGGCYCSIGGGAVYE